MKINKYRLPANGKFQNKKKEKNKERKNTIFFRDS